METVEPQRLPSLYMRRPSLTDLPSCPQLPDGYVLRPYRDEDAPALATVLEDAFVERWDDTRLRETLTENESVKQVYVIEVVGRIVATSSVRLLAELGPDTGYLHYVGASSDQRGKRLGEAVVLRVLEHFRELGLRDAVLETDDFRTAALRLYLRLGFVPEYRFPFDQQRWSKIFTTLMSPLH